MVRNLKFDLIRFTGVLVIMIAHSNPPGWLFQLRNFGTPLLILGSALTYGYIYRFKSIDPVPFFKKRLARLTFPAWAFLSFFFLFFWVASLLLDKDFPFSIYTIVSSFDFYDGIGFVWILKVYMILALMTPFCLRTSKSTISNRKYFIYLTVIYILYELIARAFFMTAINDSIKELTSEYILVVIPYSVLYLYGMRLHLLKDQTVRIIIIVSFLIFLGLATWKYIIYGHFIPTQKFKYPPTLYYLSYAFFCINLLYYFITKFVQLKNERLIQLITWLSSYSLWIYLWHIMAYYIWDFLIADYTDRFDNRFLVFCINTTFLLSFGILMTHLQTSRVNKLVAKSEGKYNKLLLYFA